MTDSAVFHDSVTDDYRDAVGALTFGGGDMATDNLWDAKGDLAVGTADNMATRLAVGTADGYVLTVDAAEPTGIKWAPATGGAPSGAAGGVLSGTYPNPGFAADMATQAELDAHTGDTSAAHAASAISADSTTLVGTGTDVQAVLEELDNGIADHLADTTAAHAATAISADSTTLVGTGTTVQAVFEEMDDAIAGLVAASGIPATIFDAQGDLIVASAADTAARLALGASGTVLRSNGTTAVWALPAGHEYDYAQRVTDLTVTATSAAAAQVVVSGNAVSYDGSTVILVEVYAAVITCDSDLAVTCNLWDGASDLGRIGQAQAVVSGSATGTVQSPFYGAARLTPSNASHTYHFKAWKGGGTAVIGAVAGTYMPAFIRITKV